MCSPTRRAFARFPDSQSSARFARPPSINEGFKKIEAHLAALGRPRTALCAADPRPPKPFSLPGFGDFNKGDVGVLKDWGITRDARNPVARSNVAPEIAPPREPCIYAYCYAVPAATQAGSFVVAGSGAWPEGGRLPEDSVARGDCSASAVPRAQPSSSRSATLRIARRRNAMRSRRLSQPRQIARWARSKA